MNKEKKDLPRKKKTLKAFLSEEDGKIAKKDIAKFGLTVISGAMILSAGMKPHDVLADCAHSSHASHNNAPPHSSHSNHCNSMMPWDYSIPTPNTCGHGSHSSHCSGGWCP
jgi:hypothetical protein